MNVTGKKHVLRRVLSVVLSLAMVLGSMAGGELQVVQAAETEEHHYEDGFCTDIGCEQPYQKPEGAGNTDNPYLIENAGQLYYFAGIVNGDSKVCINGVEKNIWANAKLTADIVLNKGVVNGEDVSLREWTAMDEYYGTFDGDNHTISGHYINEAEGGKAGFVKSLYGTCKNVGIVNSYIYTKSGNIGSITAYLVGTIENCYSMACLEADDSRYAGGLTGEVSSSNSVIRNSYFAGTVEGKFDRENVFGGISGFYTYIGDEGYFNGHCENSYYISGVAVNAVREGTEARTEQQFASGQVAYELNGDQSKLVFGQTLSGEMVSPEALQTLPVLGGRQVCLKGHTICPGTKNIEAGGYFNGTADDISYNYPNHDYENGFCRHCDAYEAPEGKGTSESPYLIENAGQLYYFAGIVNDDSKVCINGVNKNSSAHAKLKADIILNEGTVNGGSDSLRKWNPLSIYYGIFDGENHTISGLYINEAIGNDGGFIGALYGTCKNVGIVNSYIRTAYGNIGSIAATLQGTIENCYSTACLELDNASYAGGLAGSLLDYACVVRNSYFDGTVQGSFDREKVFGGITGCHGYNDLNQGNFVGICENCYYVSGMAVNLVREGAEARTLQQFASGQVSYELNGDQSRLVFGQTLSGEVVSPEAVQTLPVLGGERVCAGGHLACPGKLESEAVFFNGTADELVYDYPSHLYDEEGICEFCGKLEEIQGDGTQQNPYRIKNANHLKWFAKQLNEAYAQNKTIESNAVLVRDIYLNPETVTEGSVDAYEWKIISRYPSGAVFDGQGHSIYGLHYTGSGEFGFIRNNDGKVCDVVITGVSVEAGADSGDIGGVCVCNDGVIEHVTVAGVNVQPATESSHYIAGMVATNRSIIRDCSSYVTIQAPNNGDRVGGICANNASNNSVGATITDCDNYGEINGCVAGRCRCERNHAYCPGIRDSGCKEGRCTVRKSESIG